MGKMNKVGRNDPCPCGSGKKFKKCCGDKPAGYQKMKNVEVLTPGASKMSGLFSKKVEPPKKEEET